MPNIYDIHWEYQGKTGVHREDASIYADNFDWVWSEGNYGCDCNRSMFFFGLSYDDAFPCGDTIKITKIVPVEEEKSEGDLKSGYIEELKKLLRDGNLRMPEPKMVIMPYTDTEIAFEWAMYSLPKMEVK